METIGKLGICMDHSEATVITFSNDGMSSTLIQSMFTPEVRSKSLHRSEKHMYLKEQREQELYFNRIAESVADCGQLVLFGPTEAKSEFLHFLQENYPLDHVKIEVKDTDNMTENQQLAFVRAFFLTNGVVTH